MSWRAEWDGRPLTCPRLKMTPKSRTLSTGATEMEPTASWSGESWWRRLGGTYHMNSVSAAFSWSRLANIQLAMELIQSPRSRQWCRMAWMTYTAEPGVIGILLYTETVSFDDACDICHVHDKQDRSQHRALRHSELDDWWWWAVALMYDVLTTLGQIRVEPRECAVTANKRCKGAILLWSVGSVLIQ